MFFPAQSSAAMPSTTPSATPYPFKPKLVGKTDPLQLVSFIAGGRAFALPILVVQEINRAMAVERSDSDPQWIQGRVNLRGQSIPLVDLGQHLTGTPTGDSADARIVFVELPVNQPHAVIGLAVDKVSRVLRLDPAEIAPAPADTQQDSVEGMVTVGEEALHLLAPDRLFTTPQLAQVRLGDEPGRS